jgi:DMSO/TMAO reductase YedYZ molybdopterin-dependent catalytic subunit
MVVPNETNNMWMKMQAKIEIIKGAAGTPALSITGMTDNKKYYSLDDLKAMPQVNGAFFDKKSNSTIEVTGVALNPLLDSASIQIGATAVVFADNSGYNKTVNLTDIRADKTTMIAINSDGSLRSYGANLSTGAWVRNLTTLKVV